MEKGRKVSKDNDTTTSNNVEDPELRVHKDWVTSRLVKSGWQEQIRLICREYLRDPNATKNLSALEEYVTPIARRLVPDEVKKGLLSEIQTSLEQKKKQTNSKKKL